MKAVGELFVKWNANSFLQLCLRLRFRQQNGYAMFNFNLDNFGTYIYQVVPTTTWFGYFITENLYWTRILVIPLYVTEWLSILLVYYNY